MLYLKYGIIVFELFAALVGFLTWQKTQNPYWRFFPIYLLIIAILEVFSYWFSLHSQPLIGKNIEIYFVIPFEFLFFFWLFYKNTAQKTLIWVGIGLYLCCFFIEIFLSEKINGYHFLSFSYSVGNIIMLVFIFQYFIKLSNSDRILYFYHERMFWVSLGLLVFWLGTFPYYGLFNFLMHQHFQLFLNYSWVMIFLDYAMYILFAVGFLWSKEK